ncbi:unnamed protein product, partial [marine sediment metagenome]
MTHRTAVPPKIIFAMISIFAMLLTTFKNPSPTKKYVIKTDKANASPTMRISLP